MSLVGPRPERPELQKEIEKEVPEFGLRLQAMVHQQYIMIRHKSWQMEKNEYVLDFIVMQERFSLMHCVLLELGIEMIK